MTRNTTVRLARRPAPGVLTPDVFEIRDEPLPEPGEGEFRVRIEYVSLDPAMRGWVNEGKSYISPVGIGEVMRAFSAGYVETSRHPDFREGDAVAGLLGAQSHAVSDGRNVQRADTSIAPLQTWIGGLGMPGWTAYFGLLRVGELKEGDTVVVSAASGAVGQIVGQIARIKGARAVGIAGGAKKCRALVEEHGFDAAVDYKAGNLFKDLGAACPEGIDVYFENVGGEVLDAVLPNMNTFGRIAVCGLISAYNATTPPPGPQNLRHVLTSRLKMQGFIVFDFASEIPIALADLSQWVAQEKLTFREDVREGGLKAFPETLNLLFSGENFGKLSLKV
ncbi:MAG: NADP-dependent oxidoreductase [Stappia sp.]|uniref:NADP-dependent oxidoreductase n=1 Tax=Stappia sp. TaxID=1870903 RepID=UPI000C47ACCE|nr:NADP-dependent oxidoreductase [Stappia sp.]MAB00203.1 NADP-dependent oxidoreductase [Stappia sp.]MBM21071.1 NADP-dependent oxidoreductase [Stappia sp.]